MIQFAPLLGTTSSLLVLFQLTIFPTAAGNTQIKLMDAAGEELPEGQVVELPVSLFPEPRCTYQVRLNSAEGPSVNRQVSIGETLFHIWGCSYRDDEKGNNKNGTIIKRGHGRRRDSVYCMMVHNCTVSNQQRESTGNFGEPVEIVDEFGCSAWPGILPQINYQGDLRAMMGVQTFALDFDQPAVFFRCNIRLLLKINGRCRRPQCKSMARNDGDAVEEEEEEEEFRPPNSPLNFP